MTLAISKAVEEGAKAVVCASTGNTSASAAAYAAKAGLTCAVLVPKGKVALGKMAATLVHGARVLEVEGNFDASLDARARPRRALPGHAREQREPVPARRGRRRRVRDRRRARPRPRHPLRAGRQRRQHLEPLDGLLRVPRGRHDRRAAAAVRVPGGRRRADRPRRAREGSADDRDRDPDREPGVVGQGGGGRDRSPRARSWPSPTARSSPPTGGWRARGCSSSRRAPRASPGCCTCADDGLAPARRHGRLRPHGPRPEGPRVGDRRRGAPRPPSRPTRTPSRPSWACRAPMRVTRPRPGDVREPRPGVRLLRARARSVQRGHGRHGRDARRSRGRGRARPSCPTDGTDLVSAAIAELPPARFDVTAPPRSRSTAANRIPLERGLGSSAAAAVAGIVLASRAARPRRGRGSRLGVRRSPPRSRATPTTRRPRCSAGSRSPCRTGSVRRFDPHPELRPVLLVPPAPVATADARSALAGVGPARRRRLQRGARGAHRRGADARSVAAGGRVAGPAAPGGRGSRWPPRSCREIEDVVEELGRHRCPWCLSGAGPTLARVRTRRRRRSPRTSLGDLARLADPPAGRARDRLRGARRALAVHAGARARPAASTCVPPGRAARPASRRSRTRYCRRTGSWRTRRPRPAHPATRRVRRCCRDDLGLQLVDPPRRVPVSVDVVTGRVDHPAHRGGRRPAAARRRGSRGSPRRRRARPRRRRATTARPRGRERAAPRYRGRGRTARRRRAAGGSRRSRPARRSRQRRGRS